jgi:hypothetical protein
MVELDKDVSGDEVLQGCLVSAAVMVVGMLLISLIFSELLGWLGVKGEKAVSLGIWLVAICAGGYVAVRRNRTKSFRSALWVGAIATVLILARLPEPREGALFTEQLENVFLHPGAHWRHVLGIVLTIPAALLGWILARRSKQRPA